MKYQAIKVLFMVLAVSLLLAPVSIVLADSPEQAPSNDGDVEAGLEWLKEQQNADGGFSDGFSPESSVSATVDAIIALVAGGEDAGLIQLENGVSPVVFLFIEVQADHVEGVGTVAKVSTAVVAVGLDPTDFGGRDLIGELEAAYDADTGSYGGSIFDQALVILALANADRDVPQGAVDHLLDYQTEDGAWSFTGDTAENTGDTNTTALVIQALAAAGHEAEAEPALDYLRGVQNEDGGWPYQNPSDFGTETDANSTALVLEAIEAMGQTAAEWQMGEADPLSALLALQNDSGSFSFQASFPGDNALATIQAIPAVAGITLADLPTVKTSADPEMATAPPPTTIPEAGGSRVLPIGGVAAMIAGLLLVVVGYRLTRTRRQISR
jgi:hypothetical protein